MSADFFKQAAIKATNDFLAKQGCTPLIDPKVGVIRQNSRSTDWMTYLNGMATLTATGQLSAVKSLLRLHKDGSLSVGRFVLAGVISITDMQEEALAP